MEEDRGQKAEDRFQGGQVSALPVAASIQSNRKRNFEKANPPEADKYRISNNEYRMSK